METPRVRLRRPSLLEWCCLAVGLVPWTWYLVRNSTGRMDAIALVWPLIAAAMVIALLVAAAVVRRRALPLAALSWVLAFLSVVVLPWRPVGGPAPVESMRIVAANTLVRNVQYDAVAADVLAQDPDVVVISEVTFALDQRLRVRYAHRVFWRGVAAYSNLTLHSGELPAALADQRGVRVIVDAPAGPVVLYAMHLQKPGGKASSVEVGFRTHRRIVDHLALAADREQLPVIIAGDLNLSDRTTGYRKLTNVLDDAMRSRWAEPTSLRWSTRFLLARIDHILMPEQWCSTDSRVFHLTGSDHRGVAATVGPCPGADVRTKRRASATAG